MSQWFKQQTLQLCMKGMNIIAPSFQSVNSIIKLYDFMNCIILMIFFFSFKKQCAKFRFHPNVHSAICHSGCDFSEDAELSSLVSIEPNRNCSQWLSSASDMKE